MDIVTYTANAANVFTVTGVSQAHDSGVTIQYVYSLPSDIDEQEITYLNVNGTQYTYVSYTDYLNSRTQSNVFTIFDSRLFLPQGQAKQIAIMTYMQSITVLSGDTDKPTLIPNKWRKPLLIYGAVAKLAARDDLRTGWDWYEQKYKEAVIKFYAEANNRVRSKNRKNQGSVYD
mgnify:CR=1 FL=1